MKKIAVIGAGLSGLTCAHFLKDHAMVTLFEKARGPSGRISTRRALPYIFDHGAQYFTARSAPFQNFIQPFIEDGLVERWQARYQKFDGVNIMPHQDWESDIPRYVGRPSMHILGKQLAADLTRHGVKFYFETKITQLKRAGKWQLTDDNAKLYDDFDWVISTLPAPQASQILPQSCDFYNQVHGVKMLACFALMLGFAEPLPVAFEAAHIINSDLSWLAVNSHKPGRDPTAFTLVVHAASTYSEANFEEDTAPLIAHLCDATSQLLGINIAQAPYKNLHRWRYANTSTRTAYPLFLDSAHHIAQCGDWCEGGRVEGAFLSAYKLSKAMITNLLSHTSCRS